MRNIVHLITTIDRGGAEKQLQILVQKQILQGYSVTIVPLKGKNELEGSFCEIGARVDSFILNQSFLKQFFFFGTYSSKNRFLLHVHLPRAELIGAACRKKNILIGTKHVTEMFLGDRLRFFSPFVSRWVTGRMHFFISITRAVLDYMIDTKQLNESTVREVVHYGYDPQVINENDDRLKHAKMKKSYRIGTVARLVPQKDLKTLLRTFSLIRIFSDNYELEIVGRGILRRELQEYANDLNLPASSITWTEHEEEISKFFSRINVFVLTSKYEGFGLVLLEAMQSNIPIIASNISPIREVLGESFPTLSEVGNEKIFAENIFRLEDKKFREYVLELQMHRLEKFNPVMMAEKINTIYTSLVAKHSQ